MEKDKEIDQKIDPSFSHASEPMKPEESQEKPSATCVSALDMILKSLRKIRVFLSDVLIVICQETHQRFAEYYLGGLHDLFLNNLSPLEENCVSEILLTVLEHLPRWNRHFEVYELVKVNCNRCKMDKEYPPERSYGIIIIANTLRETKSAFEHFSLKDILKVIRNSLEMHCEKEGCGKQTSLLFSSVINKLPSVFTIALEWENNETEEEIYETISVLAIEIDISGIYQYEGDCPDTKYHLVSMVCLHGDQYNCVAYENEIWVRHFGTEEEVIGDWGSVLSTFVELNMRPEILFFENAKQREKIVNKQRSTKIVKQW